MNYKFHYDKLIDRARDRVLSKDKESHHIIPRCMGGSNDKSNLVDLTPEEHYLAHQLLVKIHPRNNILIYAAVMMIPNRPSNKLYGWLRRRFSSMQSDRMSGEGNTQYGTRWIYNLELKETRKISNKSDIPIGWELGRIVDFDSYLTRIETKQKILQDKELKILQDKELYIQQKKIQDSLNSALKKNQTDEAKEAYRLFIIDLYNQFTSGNYYSISEFHKQNNIPVSRMTLSNYWRKWIPEYKDNSKEGKRYRK